MFTIKHIELSAQTTADIAGHPTEAWQVVSDDSRFIASVSTSKSNIPQHWFVHPTFTNEADAQDAAEAAVEELAMLDQMLNEPAATYTSSVFHGDGRYTDVYSDGSRYDRDEF